VLAIEGLEKIRVHNLISSFENTASGLKNTKPAL